MLQTVDLIQKEELGGDYELDREIYILGLGWMSENLLMSSDTFLELPRLTCLQ